MLWNTWDVCALQLCVVLILAAVQSTEARLWMLPCAPLVHLAAENCSDTVAMLHSCDATRSHRSSVIVLVAPAAAGGVGRPTVSNLTLLISGTIDVNVVVQDVALEDTLVSIADSGRRASLSCSASVVAAHPGVCRRTALSIRNVTGRNVSLSIANYTVDADVGWASIENTTLVASRVTLQRVSRGASGTAHPIVLSAVALLQSTFLVADANCVDSILLASLCVLRDHSTVSLLSSVVLPLPAGALRIAVRLSNVTAVEGSGVDLRSMTISSSSTALIVVSVASSTFSVRSGFAMRHSRLTSLGGAGLLEVSDTAVEAGSEVLVHENACTSSRTTQHVLLRRLLVLSSSVRMSSNVLAMNVTRENIGVVVLSTSTLSQSDVVMYNNTWALMSPTRVAVVPFLMMNCSALSTVVVASRLTTGSSTALTQLFQVQSSNITSSFFNVSVATVRVGIVSVFLNSRLLLSVVLFSDCSALGLASTLQLWSGVRCAETMILLENSTAGSGQQLQGVALQWSASETTRSTLDRHSLITVTNCVLRGAVPVRFANVDVLNNSAFVLSQVTVTGGNANIVLFFENLTLINDSRVLLTGSRISGGTAVYVTKGYCASNSSIQVLSTTIQSALHGVDLLDLTVVDSSALIFTDSKLVSVSSYAISLNNLELHGGSCFNVSRSDVTTESYSGVELRNVLVNSSAVVVNSTAHTSNVTAGSGVLRGTLWTSWNVSVWNRSTLHVVFKPPRSDLDNPPLPIWLSTAPVIYASVVDVVGKSSVVFAQQGLRVMFANTSSGTTAYYFENLRLHDSSIDIRGAPTTALFHMQWRGTIVVLLTSSIAQSNVTISSITATVDGSTSIPTVVLLRDITVVNNSIVTVSVVRAAFSTTPSSALFVGARAVYLHRCSVTDSSLVALRNISLAVPVCSSGSASGAAVLVSVFALRLGSALHCDGVFVDAPLCSQVAFALVASSAVSENRWPSCAVAVSAVVTNGNSFAVLLQDTLIAASLVSVYNVTLTRASARSLMCDGVHLSMSSRLVLDTLRSDAVYATPAALILFDNVTIQQSSQVDVVAFSCGGAACIDAYDMALSANATLRIYASTMRSSRSALLFRNIVVSSNSSVICSASVLTSLATTSPQPGVVLNMSGVVTDSSVQVLASNSLRYAHACDALYVLTSLRVVNSTIALSAAVQRATCGPLRLDGVFLDGSSVVVSGRHAVMVLRTGGLVTFSNVSLWRSSTLLVSAWGAQSTSGATLLSLTGVSLQQLSQLLLQQVFAWNVSGGLMDIETFQIRDGSTVVVSDVSFADTRFDTGCAAVCRCPQLILLRGGLIADFDSELCVTNVVIEAAPLHGGLLLVSNVTVRGAGRLVLLRNSSIEANRTAALALLTVANSAFMGPASAFALFWQSTVVIFDTDPAGGSFPQCSAGNAPLVALCNVTISACDSVELLRGALLSVTSLRVSVEFVVVSNGSRIIDSTVRVLCSARVFSNAAIAAAWVVSAVLRLDTDAASTWDNATVVVDALSVMQTFYVSVAPRTSQEQHDDYAVMTTPSAVLVRVVGSSEGGDCFSGGVLRRSAVRVRDTVVQVIGLPMASAYTVSYEGWPARFLNCSVTNVTAMGAGFLHAVVPHAIRPANAQCDCCPTLCVVIESAGSAFATNGSSGVVVLNASSWRFANTTLNVTLTQTQLTSGSFFDLSRRSEGLALKRAPLFVLVGDSSGNMSIDSNGSVVGLRPLPPWNVVVDDCTAVGFQPFMDISGDPLRPAAAVSVYCTRWGDVRESVQMIGGRSVAVSRVRYQWLNAATLRNAAAFWTEIAIYPFSVHNRKLVCPSALRYVSATLSESSTGSLKVTHSAELTTTRNVSDSGATFTGSPTVQDSRTLSFSATRVLSATLSPSVATPSTSESHVYVPPALPPVVEFQSQAQVAAVAALLEAALGGAPGDAVVVVALTMLSCGGVTSWEDGKMGPQRFLMSVFYDSGAIASLFGNLGLAATFALLHVLLVTRKRRALALKLSDASRTRDMMHNGGAAMSGPREPLSVVADVDQAAVQSADVALKFPTLSHSAFVFLLSGAMFALGHVVVALPTAAAALVCVGVGIVVAGVVFLVVQYAARSVWPAIDTESVPAAAYEAVVPRRLCWLLPPTQWQPPHLCKPNASLFSAMRDVRFMRAQLLFQYYSSAFSLLASLPFSGGGCVVQYVLLSLCACVPAGYLCAMRLVALRRPLSNHLLVLSYVMTVGLLVSTAVLFRGPSSVQVSASLACSTFATALCAVSVCKTSYGVVVMLVEKRLRHLNKKKKKEQKEQDASMNVSVNDGNKQLLLGLFEELVTVVGDADGGIGRSSSSSRSSSGSAKDAGDWQAAEAAAQLRSSFSSVPPAARDAVGAALTFAEYERNAERAIRRKKLDGHIRQLLCLAEANESAVVTPPQQLYRLSLMCLVACGSETRRQLSGT